MMLRKMMIALAATTFMGAMAVATTADARSGGHGGGMGGHVGGFGGHAGGFSGHIGGAGVRMGGGPSFHTAGIRSSGFVGSRNFAVNRGFARNGAFVANRAFVGNRHFAGQRFARFHHRRNFAAVPFFVGGAFASSYYDDPCLTVEYTPWGPTYVNACGYDYWY